jgi:exodeoxyribonuclease III
MDIKNWRGNIKKSGFLPRRTAVAHRPVPLASWGYPHAAGWVDVVRVLHPDVPGPYSWWSWRGRAFDNDAGWRIDYHLATHALAARASAARVERAAAYALRWSDHAPVTVEYLG